jgi:hypothetical protein
MCETVTPLIDDVKIDMANHLSELITAEGKNIIAGID